MLDRSGKILRWACLLLAALLVYQLAQLAPRVNPLRGVVIPELPTLAVAEKTNAPVAAKPETNAPATPATNKPVKVAGTNAPVAKSTNDTQTVLVPPFPETESAAYDAASGKSATNSASAANIATNLSNAVPSSLAKVENNGSNSTATTNAALTTAATGTNASNVVIAAGASTNATNVAQTKRKGRANGAPGMARFPMGPNGGGAPLPELPVEVKARINRVYESEILGQVIRPMPMGLMGIAGDVAFLRSASGQTGLVKEGDTLGDLKLLRIGINRVLVEQNGEKKELTIFDGYGSKSLLSDEGKIQK